MSGWDPQPSPRVPADQCVATASGVGPPGNVLTLYVDPLVPWSLGGTEDPTNLATSRSSCNVQKRARTSWEVDEPRQRFVIGYCGMHLRYYGMTT